VQEKILSDKMRIQLWMDEREMGALTRKGITVEVN
jgi:hypothetical protein